jgi:hypothetical protein
MNNMDKVAERASNLLGSAPVILGFAAWMVWHNTHTKFSYVSFISDLAIELAFLILRGENVAMKRTEQNVKDDLRKSDEVLAILKEGK